MAYYLIEFRFRGYAKSALKYVFLKLLKSLELRE